MHFTVAMFRAQNLETEIVNAMIIARLPEKDHVTMQEIDAFMDQQFTYTLGKFIRELKKYVSVHDELAPGGVNRTEEDSLSVPDFQSLMLPTLTVLSGGVDTSVAEVRQRVAAAAGLTPEALQELLTSGKVTKFANRVGWALVHLQRAGLVEKVQCGIYRLAAAGEQLLVQSPPRIDVQLLRHYPAYVAWREAPSQKQDSAPTRLDDAVETPEEVLDLAAAQLRQALEADLLDRVRAAPSTFLERVVVDLLIAMGYGGGNAARGRVTGQAGDGTIREDALGLDEVYLQAKKYAPGTTVGEGDLRNFAGAIDAANTTKGVFVTTAGFTRSATDYVAKSPKRIVLIDGEELARLMVVHEIGVRTRIRYEVKRIDEDYFAGEDL